MRGEGGDCGIGAAAAINRDARGGRTAYVRVGLLHLIEFPVEVERRLLEPGFLQHLDILLGAPVAAGMIHMVSVFGLIRITAARDHMHGQPAAAELIQSCQLPGSQGRRHETRTVCQ